MAPGRPLKKIEEWPFSPPPLGEAGAAHTLKAELVEVLVNAGGGILARALARAGWPFLWNEEPRRAQEEVRDEAQRKVRDEGIKKWLQARDEAPREAVERWLKTHARNIKWKLELLGARSNNRRDDMKAARNAYESAACRIRRWIANPADVKLTDRAAAAVEALPSARNVSRQTPLRFVGDLVTGAKIRNAAALARGGVAGVPDWIKSSPEEFERVASDIDEWLTKNPAKGGANLASREVAEIVARFFNDARKAAHEMGVPIEDMPRVVFADDDDHDPTNQYCVTVKSALEGLGQSPDSWRYAAKFVYDKQRKS